MRRSIFIDACLLGFLAVQLLATVPITVLMSGPAEAGRPALVLAPPWGVGAERIIAAAGGTAIGAAGAPMARIAVFEWPSRAIEAGAWAVLDARALASLCGFKRI